MKLIIYLLLLNLAACSHDLVVYQVGNHECVFGESDFIKQAKCFPKN